MTEPIPYRDTVEFLDDAYDSLIDTEGAEESAARQLTDQIKTVVEGAWQLIQEAYTSRAWAALGYESWDAYCSAEFGTSRLRLPREERQEVVGSLRDAGLSTRAIAAATGLNQSTISRDLGATDANASVAEVRGVNGKSYSPTRPTPTPVPEPEPVAYSDADLLGGRDWAPATTRKTQVVEPEPPAPRPMPTPGPPALTPEEQQERIRLVAKQEYLNAYSGAVDGLIAMESYAASGCTPPAEIPGHYPALPVVVGRIEAVLSTWKNWNTAR